jgi:hypothetical protein
VGSLAKDYLVRFIPTNVSGVYNIQFANGRYIDSSLNSGAQPGNYFFYNINNTDGHFAWNKTSDGTTYGSIVDNNGAGNTVAFWESGQVTWTDGNNDWKIYPVTFFEKGDYTWYTIKNHNGAYISLNGDYMDGNHTIGGILVRGDLIGYANFTNIGSGVSATSPSTPCRDSCSKVASVSCAMPMP